METESIIDYLNLSGCYPEWDEFSLLVCDICGTIIRPQAFEKHLKAKHQIGVQNATTPIPATNTNSITSNSQQPQPQKQISLPNTKPQLDQQQQQQRQQPSQPQVQVQQQPPQKITINPPPPTIDRKPMITARTTITTVPNIKPTTITAATAIKTTTNSNNIANVSGSNGSPAATTNNLLKSSKPVKRPAPSANISISTTNKQSQPVGDASALAPPPVKTKPKARTKVGANSNSKTQQPIAATNGKSTKGQSANSKVASPQPPQPASFAHVPTTPAGFFDPSFYGLEPLSPPSSATGGPLSSSSSASSTSSSASSSGSSTNSSLSYCTSLSNHNHHRNIISLPLNGSANALPPPAFLSKYQDRKWRNTYNVLRDAFF